MKQGVRAVDFVAVGGKKLEGSLTDGGGYFSIDRSEVVGTMLGLVTTGVWDLSSWHCVCFVPQGRS